MKRIFYLSFFFFLLFFRGFSQTVLLSGKVTEFRAPLPGVKVYVPKLEKGTYTDADGHYQLRLPKGKHELVFRDGRQKQITVTLIEDQTLNVDFTDNSEDLNAVFITAYRVDADSPISFSNLENKEIEERNLGQDIPILMNFMPSVVTTSDAGAGIGYTGLRVRGSDGSRINTTINGIPLNDGESQGVFWVNLGDFTSSVENLQLQRGVGTSTNGAGAFGASLNILTTALREKPELELTNTYGSFNTHKHHLKFDTGLLKDRFSVAGSFGLSKSDGYRDRAFSDLKSYMLQAGYDYGNTLIKALSFGGSQQTYQAYYGVTKEQLRDNRRYNPAGMYIDKEGKEQFYDNQTDNYKQDHLQLLWNQRYDSHWSSNLTLHYTYGRGYYESYHQEVDFEKYGLENLPLTAPSDLVNQKWLDNHFMGTVFDLDYQSKGFKAIIGGGWNRYWGDHYGEVIWTEALPDQNHFDHYYDNKADKRDYSFYVKTTWQMTDELSFFGDLQGRGIRYKTYGPYENQDFEVTDDFFFFNPKAGLNYKFDIQNQLYFSYARAHREPNRSDYKALVLGASWNGEYPRAEQLNDWELGWRHQAKNLRWNASLYYMDYHNQLVLTGEIDPEGRTLRKNSGRSYRLGLELEAHLKLHSKWEVSSNLTLSRNQNRDFHAPVGEEIMAYGDTEISFSPSFIFGNQIRYSPLQGLDINFLSKYVGKQYMSNLEVEDSRLKGYFVSDLNIQYNWKKAPLFKEIVFTGLVNNLFNEKYSSNGTYAPEYGASYYPQAGTNFLVGIKLRM